MGDYLACQNATQRRRVIQKAKFPQKGHMSTYSPIRKPLKDALTAPDFNRDGLEFLIAKYEAEERRETGQAKNNARLRAKAVKCFQETFNPRSFAKCTISSAPSTIVRNIAGVKVNVTLEATVTAVKDGVTHSGGISLVYAFSADRGSIRDRLLTSSGLILWTLEGGQMEPLSRLCMSVDLAEKDVVKASDNHQRLRERLTDACAEIAARWDDIEPPPDYDGPDWR